MSHDPDLFSDETTELKEHLRGDSTDQDYELAPMWNENSGLGDRKSNLEVFIDEFIKLVKHSKKSDKRRQFLCYISFAERIQKQCSFQPILRMSIIPSFLPEHFSGYIYKSDKEI